MIKFISTSLMALVLSGCTDLLLNSKTAVPTIKRVNKPYSVINSHGKQKYVPQKHIELEEDGIASYYGKQFHGRTTASGSKFNMGAYTVAHKTAHLPSVALLTYKDKTRIVLINDRGPFAKQRMVDCSHGLAKDLGFEKSGIGKVKLKVLPKETLLLKENGGNVSWDGSKNFPVRTAETAEYSKHGPSEHAIELVKPKIATKPTSKIISKTAKGKSVQKADTTKKSTKTSKSTIKPKIAAKSSQKPVAKTNGASVIKINTSKAKTSVAAKAKTAAKGNRPNIKSKPATKAKPAQKVSKMSFDSL